MNKSTYNIKNIKKYRINHRSGKDNLLILSENLFFLSIRSIIYKTDTESAFKAQYDVVNCSLIISVCKVVELNSVTIFVNMLIAVDILSEHIPEL